MPKFGQVVDIPHLHVGTNKSSKNLIFFIDTQF